MKKTGKTRKGCRAGPKKKVYLRISEQRIHKGTKRLETAHLLGAVYVQEESSTKETPA